MTTESKGDTERTAEAILHTNIGRDGVIVECRPVGQDYASERDMAHISDGEAESLRDQLNRYLQTEGDGRDAECECPFCQDGEMYRDGPKVVCDNCGEVKLA